MDKAILDEILTTIRRETVLGGYGEEGSRVDWLYAIRNWIEEELNDHE